MAREDWRIGGIVWSQLAADNDDPRYWRDIFDVAVEALELLRWAAPNRGLSNDNAADWSTKQRDLPQSCQREPVHTYGQTEWLLQPTPTISHVVDRGAGRQLTDAVNQLLADVRELQAGNLSGLEQNT